MQDLAVIVNSKAAIDLSGKYYFAAIRSNQLMWTEEPEVIQIKYTGKGRAPREGKLIPVTPPQSVKDIAYLEELDRVATMRWPIKQSFEDGKKYLGMDHYEHRSWKAWHRHMIFIMLALLFLLQMRLKYKKNSNEYSASDKTLFDQFVQNERFL